MSKKEQRTKPVSVTNMYLDDEVFSVRVTEDLSGKEVTFHKTVLDQFIAGGGSSILSKYADANTISECCDTLEELVITKLVVLPGCDGESQRTLLDTVNKIRASLPKVSAGVKSFNVRKGCTSC